jgi:predicted permease
LSHQLWQRRYDSDPGIVGRTIEVNHNPVEVVGVLPPADAFSTVFFPAVRVDLFSPVINENDRNSGNTVFLIGRMKPGVTHAEVAADLNLSLDQLKQQYPDRNSYYFANTTPLHDWVAGGLKQPLLFLWIAAGLVLAIVGFNLGGLLLARGTGRAKELALRTALGAGRLRIARQLLTECFALVAIGTIFGGLVSWGFIGLLSVRTAVESPLLQKVQLDAAALGFTVLLCLATVLLCGVAPAWRLSFGGNVQNALKEEGRGSSGGRGQSRARSALVVLEVALACVLAISAGLMVRSFLNLLKVDLGFETANLVAVRIDPVIDGEGEAYVNYLEATLDRVRALPGVEAAGLTD